MLSERSREDVTFINVRGRAVIIFHQPSGDDLEHPSSIGVGGIGVKVIVRKNVLNSSKKTVGRNTDVL